MSKYNNAKLRRFIRHLGEAASNVKGSQSVEKRKNFVEKLNVLSETSPIEPVSPDFSSLEDELRDVADKENEIITAQKRDETRMNTLSRKQIKDEDGVEMLRDEFADFENKVSSIQRADEDRIESNASRIERISEVIEKLNESIEKINQLQSRTVSVPVRKQVEIPVRNEPSVFLVKRKNVPEKPVKEKVSKSELKKTFKILEKRHEAMVKAGYHGKQDLSKLRNKISKLKKKLK
jgi:chromosome segregation ATPase